MSEVEIKAETRRGPFAVWTDCYFIIVMCNAITEMRNLQDKWDSLIHSEPQKSISPSICRGNTNNDFKSEVLARWEHGVWGKVLSKQQFLEWCGCLMGVCHVRNCFFRLSNSEPLVESWDQRSRLDKAHLLFGLIAVVCHCNVWCHSKKQKCTPYEINEACSFGCHKSLSLSIWRGNRKHVWTTAFQHSN